MCRLTKERSKSDGEIKIVGNETILGQIATFMEALHLSYKEVFEIIPYRNLILMQKDKLHECTGSIIVERSGKELMERRNKLIGKQ